MTESQALVVLIGPMAAGKTKIGKRVAAQLGAERVDTDKTIVAEHGSIAGIFQRDGEERFRTIEREHVQRAISRPVVVSLGGGAILHEQTRRDLAAAHVVYLTVSPEAVAWRLRVGKRPLVAQGGVEKWKDIFETRRPLYEELADRTYDTSRGNLDEIAQDIVAWIRAGYPQPQEETAT